MTQVTPDQYRVFGNPIEQSRSPEIHQLFADKSQHCINYQKQFVNIDDFSNTVTDFINKNGKGANVTAPFKEQALAIADELTERALLAGAVNTLTFKEGKIFGDNTDGEGLVQDLIANRVTLKKSRILLLGAGGAARGVLLPLLTQNPHSIVISNRTVSKADTLCQHFADSRLSAASYQDLEQRSFDVIINATSAGLSGNLPPLPPTIINKNVVCYDMVYGKNETAFIQWVREQGAIHTLDGLGMLVGQAAVSYSIWRGVTPEIQPVIEKLRASLK